jgi:AsmA protein
LTQSLSGHAFLYAKEIELHGYDLDGELSRFESSQHFDLLDLGAVFYAGPLGLVATKGYDFASIKRKGGTSHIHVLVARVKVEKGVATAEDVAMSTDRYRMAAQGAVDLPKQEFDDVTAAVVDAQGCVIAEQKISGTFKKPKLQKQSMLKVLTGPFRTLGRKAKSLVSKPGCKVFYSGSVIPY